MLRTIDQPQLLLMVVNHMQLLKPNPLKFRQSYFEEVSE